MVYTSDNLSITRSLVKLPGTGSDMHAEPTSCDLGLGSSLASTIQVPHILPVVKRVAARLKMEGLLGMNSHGSHPNHQRSATQDENQDRISEATATMKHLHRGPPEKRPIQDQENHDEPTRKKNK